LASDGDRGLEPEVVRVTVKLVHVLGDHDSIVVEPGPLSDPRAGDLALLPVLRAPGEIGAPGEVPESFAITLVMTV